MNLPGAVARRLGGVLLRNRDFRGLCAGFACNSAGGGGEQVLIGLLIIEATGSSAWVGVATAMYYAPQLLLGPAAGAVADWMNRRRLMRLIELGLALNLGGFAALAAAHPLSVSEVLTLTLLAGGLRATCHPVRLSYAYDLATGEGAVTALGMLNVAGRLGLLVGALVTGFALADVGTAGTCALLCACHVAAALFLRGLRSAGAAAPTGPPAPILENVREFLGEMRHNRSLLTLIALTSAVEVLGFSFATALPELATVRFEMGPEGLGLLQAARAAGGIAAAVVLTTLAPLRRQGIVYLCVVCGLGTMLTLLAGAPVFAAAVAMLALVSAMAVSFDILTQGMMQLSVPNHLRGRAMGAWVLAIGSSPIGHLEMGALAAALGAASALAINGGALVVIGLLAAVVAPRLRRM